MEYYMAAQLDFDHDDLYKMCTPEEAARQQRKALHTISHTFDRCMEDGIAPDAVAHAGIFQSLVVMVEIYGEAAVASLMKQIIDGIHTGRYTMANCTH
jgi:hypothetical protein